MVFFALISSIIRQQISTKGATTIKSRLIELVGEITPENLYKLDLASIQECGMSWRKAEYIKMIIEVAISKTIDFESLHRLLDEEVVKELAVLKEVGNKGTAFLIH